MSDLAIHHVLRTIRARHVQYSPPRGLTLIEVLAVVVVLGLTMAAIMTNAGAMREASSFDEVVHQIRGLDRQARLLARTEGGALVLFDSDRHEVVLCSDLSGEVIRSLALSRHVTIRLHAPYEEQSIRYDGAGRSADFEIRIDSESRSRMLAVHGLTGVIERLPESGL